MSIENQTPIGGEPGSILSQTYKSEGTLAIEKRVSEIIEKARLNEAVKIIEALEAEVASMEMPARFSRVEKPSEAPMRESSNMPVASLSDLPGDQHKRQVLLIRLGVVKSKILSAIDSLGSLVSEIEATKEE